VSQDNSLLASRDGALCTLTINRPERRNALSSECLLKISETMKDLSADTVTRVVVICGSGDAAFSAGFDIASLPAGTVPAPEDSTAGEDLLSDAIESIQAFPYPVIAMMSGYAYGAGCSLAAACDIRVAARNVRIGMPIAKRGIVATYSSYRVLLKVIGFSHTLEMFLTGRAYDSQRCLEMGLVNYVVESDQLKSFTRDLTHELLGNAPLSLRGTKRILNKIAAHEAQPAEIIDECRALRVEAMQSEDIKESTDAFREKRKPRFKGR
jgi:enoyl-CoA hydratase/carnithine racemase